MADLESDGGSDQAKAPKHVGEANIHHLGRSPSSAGKNERIKTGNNEQPEALQPPDRTPYQPESELPAASKSPDTGASKRSRILMFAVLPLVLVIGGYFYVTGGAVMSTDNAYVQADMVGLSTDVSGIVSEVAVRDNQKVDKGEVLFRLDQLQFQLSLNRADAQIGNTRNDLTALQANYRNVQTQVDQARRDVEFNNVNFKRQEQLLTNNFTPRAMFDASRNTLQGSQQKLASLEAQLAGIGANLNGHPDAPIEEHPRYKDAMAARNEAVRQLDHTVVKAPFAGVVTNVPTLQPGQFLAAAGIAFNIISSDHVWVQASPKETELTHVKPGQTATIEVDTYPGIQWTGTVDSISPASASSFSLLPAENTSGNWVKVVQRIPMRVRLDNKPGAPLLRAGMSVGLEVDTGHQRGFPHFISKYFRE
jgi:membrane fusion protein (multidrug efflux system)